MKPSSVPRIGLGSYACAWSIGMADSLPGQPMDVSAFLHLAAEHGLDLVQIDDNLPLDAVPGNGISVEVGTRGSAPEHLVRYLDLASFFGSPFLRLHTDCGEDRPSVEECVRRFREVLPEFRRRGIVLAVENHDRFRARDLLRLHDEAGGQGLGFCLDTVNSLGCLEDTGRVTEALAPWVVNIHVKDVTVLRDATGMGFLVKGAPVGAGMVDIAGLIERIRTEGKPFTATLELWTPRQASIEDTVALEREWIRLSLEHLRRILVEASPHQ
jgi:sugar phosphate isomerase/epimerase